MDLVYGRFEISRQMDVGLGLGQSTDYCGINIECWLVVVLNIKNKGRIFLLETDKTVYQSRI